MSTFLLFLRTLAALAIVLGLVWGLARLSRRAQGGGGKISAKVGARAGMFGEARITVVTKRSLSRSSGVAVVRVGDRTLVLGTTPHQVTLLAELAQDGVLSADQMSAHHLTPDQMSADQTLVGPVFPDTNDTPWKATSRQSPPAWDAVISTLRERTTRR
jgi:flagellar protein FliO/FliZ